jgi:hypothetical protein
VPVVEAHPLAQGVGERVHEQYEDDGHVNSRAVRGDALELQRLLREGYQWRNRVEEERITEPAMS